jgi:hypothetical protein
MGVMMSEKRKIKVSEIRASLEALWSALDSLFAEMSPADWGRPHGADWIFADLPYHLSYIDRLVVARAIELGKDLPAAEQVQLPSLNQLNSWNQGKFSARPDNQDVKVSLQQMRASRDYVRQVTAGLSDSDLDRPAWFPLLNLRGFRPARIALGFCIGHTWQHMEEARVRFGHAGTLVDPGLTHQMLDGGDPTIPLYLKTSATTLFLDAARAKALDFSFALHITSAGGGIWAFHPAEGGWRIEEVASAGTDLVLSMELDTYIKFRYFISDLGALVEAGQITANDEQALSVYGQLFVVPDFDFAFPRTP